jgi:hypothetical protein
MIHQLLRAMIRFGQPLAARFCLPNLPDTVSKVTPVKS